MGRYDPIDPSTEILIRERAECRTGSGREEKCAFCGKPLPRNICTRFEIVRDIGALPCSCAEYVAAVKRIAEEEESRAREIQQKRVRERIRELIAESGIGVRFTERTFENFKIETEWQSKALLAANEFVGNMLAGKAKGNGLLFAGSVGTGKTHLAAAIANRIMEAECPVLYGTASYLLTQIKKGWNSEGDADFAQRMCRTPLLVIDDLGKEYSKKNSDGWSWAQEQFFTVINSRYENYLPMIITTNLSIDQLSESLGEAIVSRLIECCRGVRCDGEDYRLKRCRDGK